MDDRGPEVEFDDLYQELIIDHYRRPRNKGIASNPTADVTQNNPVCGDEIRLTLRVKDGRIDEVRFLGQGCSISQSSASMMAERLQGQPVEEAEHLAAAFRSMMTGRGTGDDELGDLTALEGVSRYPVRIKCAVLAWDTLQKALSKQQKTTAP